MSLIRLEIDAAVSDSQLPALRERLLLIGRQGGAPARDAQQLMRLLDRADTLARALLVPDAFWFLRAELLRDSLGAPGAAARAFAVMGERFPRSPWTPKGLFAALAGAHPAPDSLRLLLEQRYPTSPYTMALLELRADAAAGYQLLEDSLRAALASRAIARRGVTAASVAALEARGRRQRSWAPLPERPGRPGPPDP